MLFTLSPDIDTPSISDTIVIKKWWILGPFSVGAGDGIIGVHEHFDLKPDFEPDTTSSYPSLLIQNGVVVWKNISSLSDKVEIDYGNVMWDSLADYYGVAGLLCAGYAYADFEIENAQRALVIAQGISSFRLNNKKFPGDRYKNNFLHIPVVLEKGKNRILIKMSGFANHSFSFKCVPSPYPLIVVSSDITIADIINEEIYDSWIGIPLINTTSDRLTDIHLRINGPGGISATGTVKSVMPFSGMKIPLAISSDDIIFSDKDSLMLYLEVKTKNNLLHDSIWAQVKNSDEVHIRTFQSKIDNSCQHYGVLPPKGYSQDSLYALIMTCHGAGVRARNQVQAYSQKNWAFVVAPTNRRRYGFNWQDWGRLDFLEVLEDVKRNFNIDSNRIYLTGHSMGGHGAWHIGTSHPDLFAAMAPSAGWTSIQLYIPGFLQKSATFAHPEQLKFRDMVLREDNPLLFLENLYNLPTYILQGGVDDNVPPIQSRMFSKYLSQLNYDFIYNEVENKGHWWNFDSTPSTDCVDSEELMNFLKNKVRKPYPEKIVFKTSDIDHTNQAYWVRINELENIYREAQIEIKDCLEWKNNVLIISINTRNTVSFTLFLNSQIWKNFIKNPTIRLNVNGQFLDCDYESPYYVTVYKKGDKFNIRKTQEPKFKKKPGLYGPIKRAYFEPFLLVYGTISDSASTENNLQQARMQAYTWWYRANGFVEIFPDTEVTQDIIKNYNLILIGNPWTNSIIKWINHKLPVRIEEGHIILHKQVVTEDNLCLIEIYPNPLNVDKFVCIFSATSKEAEKIMGVFNPLYAGTGLPDFIVYDQSVLLYGWAGVIAAGFFDKEWKFDKNLSYIKN